MSIVLPLLEKGQQAIDKAAKEREAKAVGTFRGGSGGLSFPNFTIGCQRLALLRYQGIDTFEASPDKALMFEAGHTNEDAWVNTLKHALPPTGRLLCEEEIPVIWKLSNGETVTGRPDIVVTDKGKLLCGIELKLISSAWTARDILMGWPKTDHLRQAGLYMWRLSEQEGYTVPFELWYTQRVNFPVSGDFMTRLFPKKGEKGSEFCKYVVRKDKDGNEREEIKDVLPFRKGWLLRFTSEGRLQIQEVSTTNSDVWQDTIITKQAIENFYLELKQLEVENKLGPRPENRDYKGTKENWTQCTYCPLSSICDSSVKSSFSQWKKKVVDFTSGKK